MQADDEKMYLENLEEYVMDEGKIVTYKWLSATLDIHVNTAKQLLYKYAMPEDSRKDGVHMTYLLSGTLQDGSGMKIQIVRENDLDTAKSKFKVITSEHVYSVQRADPLPDLNIFYGIDNLKSVKSYGEMFGAIRYKNAIRRLADDITSLKIKARAANAVNGKPVDLGLSKVRARNKQTSANSGSDKDTRPSMPTSQLCVEPVVRDHNPSIINGNTNASESESSKSVATKSSSSIAALFSAQTKAGKNTISKPNSTIETNKPTTKAAKNGIAMFFSKQNEKQSKPINIEQSVSTNNDVQSKVEEVNADKAAHVTEISTTISKKQSSSTKETCRPNINTDVDCEESIKITSKKKEKTGKNHKASVNSQNSTSSRSEKKKKSELAQPAKKRKRIMVLCDDSTSSDDDIFGKDSDSEIQPPSPEMLPESQTKTYSSDEDVIPPTPTPQKDKHNRRVRKRKLVDQTYEDKDGFIITKKEYVFESCSEDEGDKKVSKNEVNETAKSNTQNLKTTETTKESGQNGDVENNKTSKKQTKSEQQPSKKKKSSPPVVQKTKQSTLMSFFNKS